MEYTLRTPCLNMHTGSIVGPERAILAASSLGVALRIGQSGATEAQKRSVC